MPQNIYQQIEKKLTELKQLQPDSPVLDKLEKKLSSREFNLVVIGQFKRGKSTFINSLLGEKVLPTAILPLTSIVTIIQYAEKAEAVIYFQDGTKKTTNILEIDRYVTEKFNPENRLGVTEVVVLYPSDYLKSGIRIIDTPGVGSVFEHNTDVAYDYLPNSDAAIFMMSPDPPISKAELDFLRSAKEYIDKFYFVLNKKDIVPENDLKDVIEFNRNLLEKELGTRIDIVAISALKALEGKLENNAEKIAESNIKAVEDNIIEALKAEKWKIFAVSVINSLIRAADGIESRFKLRQKADALSLEELQKRIEEFKEFEKEVVRYQEENGFVLKGKIDKLAEIIDEEIEKLKQNVLPELISKTTETFKAKLNEGLKSQQLDDAMNQFMQQQIRQIFGEFEKKQKKTVDKHLIAIYEDLADRTNRIIEKIVQKASSIFEVDLKPFTSIDTIPDKTQFSFKFNDQMEALAIIGTFIRKKLPRFLGKFVIEKHIKTATEEIFDRHCGRVRYALLKAVEEATRSFKFELDEKIDQTLKAVEEILKRSIESRKQNEEKIRQIADELSRNIETVRRIKSQLEELKKAA